MKRARVRTAAGDGIEAGFGWALLVMALAGLGWAIHRHRLPLEAAFWIATASGITLIVYALDKRAARAGRWRVAEATLHVLEIAGGWPGAWLAQRLLRHKTRKPAYRWKFCCMVAFNIAAIAAWVLTHP